MNVAVSKIQEASFFRATKHHLAKRIYPFYRTDFWDADLENFRHICNNWLRDNGHADPLPRDVFEACIEAGVQPRFV